VKQPHKRRAIVYEYEIMGTDKEQKLQNPLVSSQLLVALEVVRFVCYCNTSDSWTLTTARQLHSGCLRLLHSERISDGVLVG
jgi:hypothetical protein